MHARADMEQPLLFTGEATTRRHRKIVSVFIRIREVMRYQIIEQKYFESWKIPFTEQN